MAETSGRRSERGEDVVLALVQEHAAELLRFAQRFSLCADDAHDAYQRGIEILVRRMRTHPPEHPLSWLRTVIRNECHAVRAEREQLVGHEAIDLDRHEDRDAEDPAERVIGFEQLRHTAEALQRLKPQELKALALRGQGLSYKEIAARERWTYTKVNRCVSEGRRALLERLGAIESGAECERWLPLLSALADGEASVAQLAELRPHLRACPGCRATLRRYHDAPREVAALVPVALVPLVADPAATLAHQIEAAIHWLTERATLAVVRCYGALDALPGTKLAAVAASTAAIAGGGAAIERATHAGPHAPVRSIAVAGTDATSAVAVALPQTRASTLGTARTRSAPGRIVPPAADHGEFTRETRPRTVPQFVARAATTSGRSPPADRKPSPSPPAEFAGP